MTTRSLFSLWSATFLLFGLSPHAVAQEECESTIEAVEVNGATLHYVDCGEGESVIFVHGGMGDLNTLSQQARGLASEFRTIAYSRRFHFPNAPPQEGDLYALHQHVDDLATLIAELDLGPVHLVGHSYGGYVSLAFALEHPDLVRSLVLGGPPVIGLLFRTSVGEAALHSMGRRVFGPARAAYEQSDVEGGLRRFLNGVTHPGFFESLSPEAQEEIVEKAGPESRLESLTDPAVYMPPLSCDALTGLDRPVLLLTGEESPAMFLLITAELEACFESESYAMVPYVSHKLFSNDVFTTDVILDFLRDQ